MIFQLYLIYDKPEKLKEKYFNVIPFTKWKYNIQYTMEDVVEVQIEIPKNGKVKYEYDHKDGKLKVDRFLHGPHAYPFNYGNIPDTLSLDNDPIDCVVVCCEVLHPMCYVNCKIIGALITEDEKGGDDKLILVPSNKVDPNSKEISDIDDLTQNQLDNITDFFTHYKDREQGKFVKIIGLVHRDEAIEKYKESVKRHNEKHH